LGRELRKDLDTDVEVFATSKPGVNVSHSELNEEDGNDDV